MLPITDPSKKATSDPPPLSMVWETCQELVPPLIVPLRAILFMLILVFLPHVIKGLLILATQGGYDNVDPRGQVNKLIGPGRNGPGARFAGVISRAGSCHANSWEAFSYFSVSALTAYMLKLDSKVASHLCTLFLSLRTAYIPLYLFGFHWTISLLRTTVWSFALAVSIRMTLLSLRGAGL